MNDDNFRTIHSFCYEAVLAGLWTHKALFHHQQKNITEAETPGLNGTSKESITAYL